MFDAKRPPDRIPGNCAGERRAGSLAGALQLAGQLPVATAWPRLSTLPRHTSQCHPTDLSPHV